MSIVHACTYVCVHACATVRVARQRRAAARAEGSGAVLWDTLTPDLYSITLCCHGWHKRKTHSDLIRCDWSCSAFLKPSGTLIFVVREKQEIQRNGGGKRFHGLKMENITRLPTTGVDIYVAEVIIFQSLREFSFSPSLCWPSSPLPSIRHMCRRDKGRPFVIKTPD